jgi:hypothetical protein
MTSILNFTISYPDFTLISYLQSAAAKSRENERYAADPKSTSNSLAQELNVSPFVSSAAKPVLTQTIYENDR